ncbi:MarR family winged helix-turn-helix transcriptional regulator [Brachybacterium hainanense]|uniref:MarR family winged helix-turn-helix transcriptional regulator n=1 Tax=Brachybacterium hainanense TaxID=1541174 RepID=A0ABV6RDD7_9MICO
MHAAPDPAPRQPWHAFDIDSNDPRGELVDRSALDARSVAEIDALMQALVGLRRVEEELSRASQAYMRLNSTDMRALHFLIISAHRDELATAGSLGAHLGLSSGATTKMLDRLEAAGHIERRPHPRDRRSSVLSVRPGTRDAAMSTMGRQQAGRFRAAARLTSQERDIVTRFLTDMSRELSVEDAEWAAHPGPADAG